MKPIGKGARFLVLSGDPHGREGTIAGGPDEEGRYAIEYPGVDGLRMVAGCDLESVRFKRLPDPSPPLG